MFHLQHDAAQKAVEDAQHQIDEILEKIKNKKQYIAEIEIKIEKMKVEALEAHKLEQVQHLYYASIFFSAIVENFDLIAKN